MKKIFRMISAAAAAFVAAAAMTVTVFAEDYEFDVSTATQSHGSWGQSFTHYTVLTGDPEQAENFNPQWMTEDSEVLVEYTYEGTAALNPCELIWQTWEGGPVEKNPDVVGNWNKVIPYEYDDSSAKFSYADIVTAYGTDDFSSVYAINIGDTGVKLTVTKLTVTNVDMEAAVSSETEAAETEAAETEAEAEDVTEKETEAETETEAAKTEETTALTTPQSIADNAPDEGGAMPIVIMVIAIVVVVAVIVVIVILMIKKSRGRYY